MIVILKPHAEPDKVQSLLDGFAAKGLSHHISTGQSTTIVGIIGDTSRVDIDSVLANDAVQDVKRVSEPYKAANRKFHPEDTVIGIDRPAGETVKIGGGHFAVAGRPLLRRKRGADHPGGAGGKSQRGTAAAGRCLQAPDLAVRVPGTA